MPILLFLIDTSASMNQRAYLGTSYLDIAKGAVEIFMKLRARDPASRGDSLGPFSLVLTAGTAEETGPYLTTASCFYTGTV
ncbi:hypothetical protein HGM15179_021767 [Zosterops borbonicus]|uniref:VWFA domain-containing protein n=1 Tax=Zosterops borbonicus TaxID=364589 RepID=A0A8K1D3U2_9PASS|nr:hypothetical protein HGM15179_021767 [Zosterops borbonicus]